MVTGEKADVMVKRPHQVHLMRPFLTKGMS